MEPNQSQPTPKGAVVILAVFLVAVGVMCAVGGAATAVLLLLK